MLNLAYSAHFSDFKISKKQVARHNSLPFPKNFENRQKGGREWTGNARAKQPSRLEKTTRRWEWDDGERRIYFFVPPPPSPQHAMRAKRGAEEEEACVYTSELQEHVSVGGS